MGFINTLKKGIKTWRKISDMANPGMWCYKCGKIIYKNEKSYVDDDKKAWHWACKTLK